MAFAPVGSGLVGSGPAGRSSYPWWRVQLAAHIDGEELRFVTQVAFSKPVDQPDWKMSSEHPDRPFALLLVGPRASLPHVEPDLQLPDAHR